MAIKLKKIKSKESKKKIPAKKKSSAETDIKKKINELEAFKKKMSAELGKIKIKYVPGKAVNNAKKEIAKNLEKIGKLFEQGAKKIMK
jgi:hypothetical protein